MAIHRCVRLERLPKLSGSALRLLLCKYLQPHACASTRLSAHQGGHSSRLQTPYAVVDSYHGSSALPGSIAPMREGNGGGPKG